MALQPYSHYLKEAGKRLKSLKDEAMGKTNVAESKKDMADGKAKHAAVATHEHEKRDEIRGKKKEEAPPEEEKKEEKPEGEEKTEEEAEEAEDKKELKKEKEKEQLDKERELEVQQQKITADRDRSETEEIATAANSKNESISRIRASNLTEEEKEKQIKEVEKDYEKQEKHVKKKYKELKKLDKKRFKEKEEKEGKPSVRTEHKVVFFTFYGSIVLFIITLGFASILDDWVMGAVLGLLFLSSIAYIICKRKAADKKTNWKFLTALGIVAILVVSLLPGLICDSPLGAVPVLGYTCALESTVSQPVRTLVGTTVNTIFSGVKSWLFGLVSSFTAQNPLIKNLKMQSCYPFCTDPTGEDTSWHGLEVSRLEIIPHTIYSHQQFSIVIEFENKGKTPATFTPPKPEKGGVGDTFWVRLKQLFGFFEDYEFEGGLTLGCTEECTWNFGIAERLASIGDEEDEVAKDKRGSTCKEICPLNAATEEKPYIVGGCANKIIDVDGNLMDDPKCTLEPGDILRMTWYGLNVSESLEIGMGEKISPDVELGLKYTYTPGNDLIGTLSMMSAETQVAGAEERSIGKIANKISQSYSPTGPLMMAMGTAETQVISGSPMFFMVQFTNKGKGTIPKIDPSYQLLYIPTAFKPRLGGCDFEKIEVSTQLQAITDYIDNSGSCEDWKDPVTCSDWYPGPNFVEGYNIYRPKIDRPIQTVGKGQDPLYNPMYTCIVDTPIEAELKSYVFKYRVVEYPYQEEAKTDLDIIGTQIAPEPVDTGEDGKVEEGQEI